MVGQTQPHSDRDMVCGDDFDFAVRLSHGLRFGRDRSVVIVFALVPHSADAEACAVHHFKQCNLPRGTEGNHQLPDKSAGAHFAARKR